MQQAQADKIEEWFDGYVAGFYNDDEFANANWKMKEDHSRRVCGESVRLAGAIGLGQNSVRLAQALGLLHDIGRFEQFARYRTYHDPNSTPHGPLGAEILDREGVLVDLDESQRQIILTSVEHHAARELPPGLTGNLLLFARLIRDADKIDVYRVVTTHYRRYKDDPENFELEVELPDEPTCSEHLIENILAGRQTDYNTLRTLNDLTLLQLGWVRDINFPATLKRLRQLKYLDKMISFLPETEQIEQVAETVRTYMNQRIKQGY